ncbi:MAG: hypothetical protein ACLP4R_01155 [Solirubrobacteraceae bacterium]
MAAGLPGRFSGPPVVTDLGQDKPASIQKKVPDFILRVRNGQNYGFWNGNWVVAAKCTKFATPFKVLAPHTDPGGLGSSATACICPSSDSSAPPRSSRCR